MKFIHIISSRIFIPQIYALFAMNRLMTATLVASSNVATHFISIALNSGLRNKAHVLYVNECIILLPISQTTFFTIFPITCNFTPFFLTFLCCTIFFSNINILWINSHCFHHNSFNINRQFLKDLSVNIFYVPFWLKAHATKEIFAKKTIIFKYVVKNICGYSYTEPSSRRDQYFPRCHLFCSIYIKICSQFNRI